MSKRQSKNQSNKGDRCLFIKIIIYKIKENKYLETATLPK